MRTIGATLAVAILTLGVPTAQQPATPKDAKAATGALPAGWKARLDDANAKPDAVSVAEEKDSDHRHERPRGDLLQAGHEGGEGLPVDRNVLAAQARGSSPALRTLRRGRGSGEGAAAVHGATHPGGWKFRIVSRAGTGMTTIVDWTTASQMADPKGVKTSNTLAIRAMQGAVHFFVGEKEVHQMPRAKAGADGIAGVRIGQNLNVQVNGLSVKKFP